MHETLIRDLRAFDWEFESCDDFRHWRRCTAELAELHKRYTEISDDDKVIVIVSLGWDIRKFKNIGDAVKIRAMRSYHDL